MESSKNTSETFDMKKEKRLASKKRKLEALLNLIDSDVSSPSSKKNGGENLKDSLKDLKQELKRLTKKPEPEVSIYLKPTGQKAKLNFFFLTSPPPTEPVLPLFSNDISNLVLKSVLGHLSPYNLGWATINNPQLISKSVLLIVEGLTKTDVIQNKDVLQNIPGLFYDVLDVATANIPFAAELSNSEPFNTTFKHTFTSLFQIEDRIVDDVSRQPSKLHLLLSPIQLMIENYPIPPSICSFSRSTGYTFTKDTYSPVNANSPMFAIDCEMCRTKSSMSELTRIAVVDENLTTVYESLVKPKAKIVDYMTKFSGITPKLLKGVTTTLEDVQKKIQELLPTDAILCGQSLNCDLHAMKMIHPYVIDTSVIFNTSGIRGKKESLKNLAHLYLKEVIQDKTSGHDPVQDAATAMRLVQLKLRNNLTMDDACFFNGIEENENKDKDVPSDAVDGSTVKESNSENGKKLIEGTFFGKSNACAKTMDNDVTSDAVDNSTKTELKPKNGKKFIEGTFFDKLNACGKTVGLIGTGKSLKAYPTDIHSNCKCHTKSGPEEIIEAAIQYKDDFDLTIVHLPLDLKNISFLNKSLKDIYDSLVVKTMFMAHVSGVDLIDHEDIKSGLFFVTLKMS